MFVTGLIEKDMLFVTGSDALFARTALCIRAALILLNQCQFAFAGASIAARVICIELLPANYALCKPYSPLFIAWGIDLACVFVVIF